MTEQAIATKKKMTSVELAMCGLFVALVVIGAYIKIMIPIGPFAVTFSLQFLFSLMAGLLMGPKKGGIALAVYLILGLIGLPVFAHGGGLGYILRPTFGFLIGFLGAAILSGLVKKKLTRNTFAAYLIAAFCGELIYYLFGLIYYYIFFYCGSFDQLVYRINGLFHFSFLIHAYIATSKILVYCSASVCICNISASVTFIRSHQCILSLLSYFIKPSSSFRIFVI